MHNWLLAAPLAVTEGLACAAAAGHWLNTTELAQLLGMASGMIRSWINGHLQRPGFEQERCKDDG